MPGVITMEPADPHGGRTDHDRSHGMNGAENGARMAAAKRYRMNDLPDEIVHIAEGFIPLSKLLARLSQHTHNALQEKLAQLARMPAPASAAPMVNGNAASSSKGGGDEYDNSPESVGKKVAFLNWLQMQRGKWIKALVIANWGRSSSDISKLIDLKSHLQQEMVHYDARLDQLVFLKRGLTFARVPSPDLRTGYTVFTTGSGDWMPDMKYIEPPPLTDEMHDKLLAEQNLALSMRLNLADFNKLPWHFRDYSIAQGRATFKVKGEFEVDLTVADEDADDQFWFIDFRLAFTPSGENLTERMKAFLEQHVNFALGREGLSGCYSLLHEYVLSHKVGELQRQALLLSRTSWAGTLSVETLDRAFSIQYWTTRQSQSTRMQRPGKPPMASTPKSWVLFGVKSGKSTDDNTDPDATSSLMVKWYRDGKEVKDATIEFDHENLSTESVLECVVAKHIAHILASIHDKLRSAPRFAKLEAAMTLSLSMTEPAKSCLIMQLSSTESASLHMEPISGRFTISPHTKYSLAAENRLNFSGKDPSEDGAQCLENMRWQHITEEATRKGRSAGWMPAQSPLSPDEIKAIVRPPREGWHPLCLQRLGMDTNWYIMMIMSLQGDEWWAFEIPTPKSSHSGSRMFMKLPIQMGYPNLKAGFWDNMTVFLTIVIAQTADLRHLHKDKLRFQTRRSHNTALPRQLEIPSIFIKLSDLLPDAVPPTRRTTSSEQERSENDRLESRDGASKGNLGSLTASRQQAGAGGSDQAEVQPQLTASTSRKRPWAHDFVEIRPRPACWDSNDRSRLCSTADALVRVLDRKKFAALKSRVGPRVLYYGARGEFCIQLQARVGATMLDQLKTQLHAIDRAIDCIDAMC